MLKTNVMLNSPCRYWDSCKEIAQNIIITHKFHAIIIIVFSILHTGLQINHSNLASFHVIVLSVTSLLLSYAIFSVLSMLFSKIYPFEQSKNNPQIHSIPGIIRGPLIFVISCAFLIHANLGTFLYNKMDLTKEPSMNRFQAMKELLKIVVSYSITIMATGILIVAGKRFTLWVISQIFKFSTLFKYLRYKDIAFLSEWNITLSYIFVTLKAITAISAFQYINNTNTPHINNTNTPHSTNNKHPSRRIGG